MWNVFNLGIIINYLWKLRILRIWDTTASIYISVNYFHLKRRLIQSSKHCFSKPWKKIENQQDSLQYPMLYAWNVWNAGWSLKLKTGELLESWDVVDTKAPVAFSRCQITCLLTLPGDCVGRCIIWENRTTQGFDLEKPGLTEVGRCHPENHLY